MLATIVDYGVGEGKQSAGEELSHSLPKGSDAERLVHRGHVFRQVLVGPFVRDVIDVKDRKGWEIPPDPFDQLGPVETRHVVVGDNQIEATLYSSGGVQGGPPVGDLYHFIAFVPQGASDE